MLGRIPFDNELGALNSNAEIAVNKNEKYRELFSSLLIEKDLTEGFPNANAVASADKARGALRALIFALYAET